MKKRILTGILAAALAVSMSMTAFAAGWQKDDTGWWYQNPDGSFPYDGWFWLDGNQDGIAECYYFNRYGYTLKNTNTFDGYSVNGNGAWVVDGVVQTRASY